ncbi:MAG TPA: ABC transporter permease, partial [Acetobacteraceae bacterium]|nr:ABC transporter permease [Acetobacteraceae bacterium]
GLSLRWYETVLGPGDWRAGLQHSVLIATATTVCATTLGTLAAIGLSSPRFPARRLATVVLVSPLAVPVIITAVGTYLFYAPLGLASTFQGIILAHTVLASPFVVVTVGASLAGFDRTMMRAAAICGARQLPAFRRVMLPLILPGVLSGAAFAFVTSFDEVVVALFLASAGQRTLPIVMFTGLREQMSPAITAAATLMMSISILLLVVAEGLRRRTVRRARGG